ncbi:MAG: DUF502 domain-containing protein [Synergistaceae bacterium]|nr:DUF502 domain-containing protein [Synergistaceae bacterium]
MEFEKIVMPSELSEKVDETKAVQKKNFISKVIRDFGLGCVAFTPLALFVVLIIYLVRFGKSFGSKIYIATRSAEITIAILVVLFLVIVYIGGKLRRSEQSLLSLFEKYVIEKIPVVGGWYEAFSDMVKTFTATGGKGKYLGTATVPVCGGHMIGFVTNSFVKEDGKKYLSVFVPTSPNPTTGLVLFLPEDVVTIIDKTPEEAFSTIISLGVK